MAMPNQPLAGLMQDTSDIDDVTRILASPTPAFLLRHNADAWEVATEGLPGPTWLPILSPQPMVPGAGGMRTRKAHEPKDATYADAVTAGKRAGWTYIDPDAVIPSSLLPKGVPAGRYMRSIDCQDANGNQGRCHVEAWSVPVPTPAGKAQVFEFDRAAYNKWRMSLVTDGTIAAPSRTVMESRTRNARHRVAKAEVANVVESVRVSRVDAAQAVATAHESAKVPGRGKAQEATA